MSGFPARRTEDVKEKKVRDKKSNEPTSFTRDFFEL